MKFVDPRPFADPEAAARKLMEIANSVESVQDGRIHIELINWPFLQEHRGSPAEYQAGLAERGWLWLYERGTYVNFTQAGSELFFSFPNVEAFLPLFIDEDHLRGIFHVFD